MSLCQLISVHTHARTHISVPSAGIIIHILNSHILPRQNLSAPVSRKPKHPIFSSSHLCLLPCSCHETSASVCACVCLSLRGCPQAKLCRICHYYSWWLWVIQLPKGNPVNETKWRYSVLYSTFTCNHSAGFVFLQVCVWYCAVDICTFVCNQHWVCAQCALWQIADLSGNVWAGLYFKSMSEQLELAPTTNA